MRLYALDCIINRLLTHLGWVINSRPLTLSDPRSPHWPALNTSLKARQARVVYPPADPPSIHRQFLSTRPASASDWAPLQQSSTSYTPHLQHTNTPSLYLILLKIIFSSWSLINSEVIIKIKPLTTINS